MCRYELHAVWPTAHAVWLAAQIDCGGVVGQGFPEGSAAPRSTSRSRASSLTASIGVGTSQRLCACLSPKWHDPAIMKVLVVSTPGSGHINPLLPLVEALLASGDQVAVAAAAEAAPLVERTAAQFVPAGNSEGEWFGRLQARIRGNPGDGVAPERINHYFLPRLFGEIATDDMIDDVVAFGRDFDPDLVVFETYALAGPLAADVLRVPSVHQLLSSIPDHEVMKLVDDAVSPLWRSFGRETPGYAGGYRDVTVEICPQSLESLRVPSGDSLALRPAPLPQVAPQRSSLPLVYVTLGTFFNANLDIFRAVLDGLADEPIAVVATVGSDQDPAGLGPVPGNARVERFILQATLLPTCTAVVHHGGAGTTFGSLAHGLPQVVIPQGAANFDNAAMVERAGVALVLRPGEVTADNVQNAVRLILNEPGLRRGRTTGRFRDCGHARPRGGGE
jgi:UDP:flavonoid glycosyltransferase YjiC (YdhE family)